VNGEGLGKAAEGRGQRAISKHRTPNAERQSKFRVIGYRAESRIQDRASAFAQGYGATGEQEQESKGAGAKSEGKSVQLKEWQKA
jgi:hypothetical protein